jgi:hypothetical protein
MAIIENSKTLEKIFAGPVQAALVDPSLWQSKTLLLKEKQRAKNSCRAVHLSGRGG